MAEQKNYIVTGCAGFIGFHVAKAYLAQGHVVIGIDNVNDYYDVNLKKSRLQQLALFGDEQFIFLQAELANYDDIKEIVKTIRFRGVSPQTVIHLAAQAGVTYVNINPWAYLQCNLTGFWNMLLLANSLEVSKFLYASSSSVYGEKVIPFSESDSATPVNLYGVTKKSNEDMAYAFYHNTNAMCVGMRFFNVYGPWGRPDSVLWKFADAIMKGEPLEVRGHFDGSTFSAAERDFTYISDVVKAIMEIESRALHTISPLVVNIGGAHTVDIIKVATLLAKHLKRGFSVNAKELEHGELLTTRASTRKLKTLIGYAPSILIETGVEEFVRWYKEWMGIDQIIRM